MGTVTEDEVVEYLTVNKEFTRDYFLKYATPKLIESWVMRRSSRLSVPDISVIAGRKSRSCMDMTVRPILPRKSRPSVDYSIKEEPPVVKPLIPEKKLTSEQLQSLDEKELLMELIRDIAYDLNMDSISHKILVNVCILTGCDRASLFLCKGIQTFSYTKRDVCN